MTVKNRNTILKTLFTMQDNMNSKVDVNWKTSNYAWFRAIWIEAAELVDSFDWKWWKKQNVDIDNVKVELVDIFHFILSQLIESNDTEYCLEIINKYVEKNKNSSVNDKEFYISSVEELVKSSIDLDIESVVDIFFFLWLSILPEEELYIMYITKNLLNIFRQQNGYNKGTYIKIWNGEEDNIVAYKVVKELDINSLTFKEDFLGKLQVIYNNIKGV